MEESTSPITKISSTTTPKPDGNVCNLDYDPGDCESYVHKWYFDKSTKSCNTFVWGGCGGNGNRFNSQSDCLDKCLGNDTLIQSVEEVESTEPAEEGGTTEKSDQRQAQLGWYTRFLAQSKVLQNGHIFKSGVKKA